jgi:hypothetical protein
MRCPRSDQRDAAVRLMADVLGADIAALGPLLRRYALDA